MSAAAQAHPCPHCGTPTEGAPEAYCCHGCESAASLLQSAGLERWYSDRQAPAPRSTTAAAIDWSALPHQVHDDGTVSACLAVDGLRCASCVWVTEQLLRRTEGVQDATVSFASGKARLRWDPSRQDLAHLTERIATLGYRPRPAGAEVTPDRDLILRLGVAAFGAMNVMGLSAALYVGWFDGIDVRYAQLMRWLALLVSTPVAVWSAAPFYEGALQSLRARVVSLDLPIAVAVALMYAHGVAATLAHEDGWLDSLTMLVALLLAGRLLEARGRRHTAEAATTLAAIVPRTARRVGEGTVELVPTSALRPGDRVAAGVGDEIPADGVIIDGEADVRLALLTGEAEPVRLRRGDRVVAGAVVDDGALTVAVTHDADHSLVAELAAGLDTAGSAPREPSPADHLAPAFTLGTLLVAGTVAVVLASQGQPAEALARAVAVLVVACPCALALAVPLVGAAGLASTARRGLLLRAPDVLDRLARVDVVVLDKTGTVTEGRPRVTAADDAVLRVAAGLERHSRHPIALAILDAAAAAGVPIPQATDVEERPGVGITGVVDGARWTLRAGGPGVVLLEGPTTGIIRTQDVPRPEVAADLARLRSAGLRVHLLSGDHDDVAQRVGREAGVDEARGGATPASKVAAIQALKADGHTVLFVGDGINDALAIATADVGVAMAQGAAPSLLAADGVLSGDRLLPLAAGVRVARQVVARQRFNILRSVVYNVAAVVAAVGGVVSPLVAAVLMPLSSAMVITSAARVEVEARGVHDGSPARG